MSSQSRAGTNMRIQGVLTFAIALMLAIMCALALTPGRAIAAGGPTVPKAPVITSATPGNAAVTVTWTPPSSDGGSPVTNYDIYVYDSTGANIGVATAAATATSFVVNSSTMTVILTNGDKYKFGVQAINAIGPSPISKHSGYVVPSPDDAPWSKITSQLAAVTEQSSLTSFFTPVGSPVVVSDGTPTGGIVAITGEANGAPAGTEEAVSSSAVTARFSGLIRTSESTK